MSPRRLLGAIALASLALTSIAHGQTPDAGRADAAPPADAGLAADAGPADRDELLGRRQAIETLIAGIPAEATDEASLARRQELGRQIELIDQMRAAVADRARRLNAVADDSRERQSLDTELRAFTALPPPGAPAQVNAEDVGRVEAEVEANRRTVAALDAEVTRAEARLAELPRLIAEARRRGRTATELSRALAAQLATLPLGDARDQLALRLDTARLDARAGAEVAEDLEVEQAMLQASGRLLTQQRDLARRQLARSEQILELHRKAYESTLTEKQADVDRALVAAREALIEARDRPGVFLATWRVRLIESQVKLAEASRLRLSVARALAQQSKLLEADASELRGLQGLVEGADASERIADKLKEIALRLDRRHDELERVRQLPEVSAAQIARTRRFEVSDLLYEIDEPWRAETEMIETGLSATERGAFAEAARKLREQVRDALRDEQNALAELLAEGEALRGALAERVETLDQLDAFVRARVFWVQDAPPLGREVWRQAKNDIARLRIWLAGPALRRPEGTQPGWPLVWTGAVVALLSLVLALVHLRLRRVMRGLRADDDLPLMQRLRFAIVGLLSAGLLPLWVWLLGHLAAATDLPPALLAPVRAALTHAALALAALHLGRFLFRPGGFAEGELNLRPETAAALRKAVQILAGGYALFLAPRSALVAGPLRLDALPRLLYTLADMTAIYTLIRLGRPRSPIIRDLLHQLSRPGLARFVPPIGAFLLVFGLLIISMDVLGYGLVAGWLAGG
ncbi:MAG: hypothetical protein KC620_15725 [Myxococcales bacterium]|nr:hypothetical protein [Myxococcales bacterium]